VQVQSGKDKKEIGFDLNFALGFAGILQRMGSAFTRKSGSAQPWVWYHVLLKFLS
jgi:hypothetical protein